MKHNGPLTGARRHAAVAARPAVRESPSTPRRRTCGFRRTPAPRRRPRRSPTTSPTTPTTSTTACAPGCSTLEALEDLPLRRRHPRARSARNIRTWRPSALRAELIRRLITAMVEDAIAESRRRIERLAPRRRRRHPRRRRAGRRLLRRDRDRRQGDQAASVARGLSQQRRHGRDGPGGGGGEGALRSLPRRPDGAARGLAAGAGRRDAARTVADFLAGMTDRYALAGIRAVFRRHAGIAMRLTGAHLTPASRYATPLGPKDTAELRLR